MRQAVDRSIVIDDEFIETMESCVQCRGCETACPSAVPFGHMMVETRRTIAAGPRRRRSHITSIGLRLIEFGWLVRVASVFAAIGQRLRLVPSQRLGLPKRLPIRRRPLHATGDDVWLFTGCVMDAWYRDIHADAMTVIGVTGHTATPSALGGCCGALAEHAGLGALATAQARRTMASMPGTSPILVDAAGCGAMLKEYGQLLGSAEATAFSERVNDVSEWLAERLESLPTVDHPDPASLVSVQDPCHLRHVQRAHMPVRALLDGYASVVELDDEGMCCGAGGAFALTQPELADAIRSRKLASIARAGAPVVASSNPGCSIHLEWAGIDVRHPVSIVAAALQRRQDRQRG